MCDNDDNGDDERPLRPPSRSILIKEKNDDDDVEENVLLQQQQGTVDKTDAKIIDEMKIEDLRELVKDILEITTTSTDDDNTDDNGNNNTSRIRSLMNVCFHRQRQQQIQMQVRKEHKHQEEAPQEHDDDFIYNNNESMLMITKSTSQHDDDIIINNNEFESSMSKMINRSALLEQNGVSSSSADVVASSAATAITTTTTTTTTDSSQQYALDPPTSPIPPLLRKSRRSHDVDDGIEPPGALQNNNYVKKRQQLVVLCNRKPITLKECNDQDSAMALCKKMGIIPCVVLSSESTTASEEEQLLIDKIIMLDDNNVNAVASASEASEASDTPVTTRTNNTTSSSRSSLFLYPQFFLRDIVDDNDKNTATTTSIEYKGDYDVMETLYETGSFTAESLLPTTTEESPSLSSVLDDGDIEDDNDGDERRQQQRPGYGRMASIGDFDKPLPHTPRRSDSPTPSSQPPFTISSLMSPQPQTIQPSLSSSSSSPSVQQPSPSSIASTSPCPSYSSTSLLKRSSHHSTINPSSNHSMPMSQLYNQNSKESIPSDDDGDGAAAAAAAAAADASYSHLDGLNQPKNSSNNNQTSTSSVGLFGEMSLGDDLRMIFDIDNKNDGHNNLDDDNNKNKNNSSSTPPPSAGVVTVPTIAEDDEEDEDDDEDDDVEEEEEEEEHDDNNNDGTEQQHQHQQQHEDQQKVGSKVSVEISPLSGRTAVRETVTLKSSRRRPQQEPPGTTAVHAVGRAKNSLKPSPPPSLQQQQQQQQQQPPNSKNQEEPQQQRKKKKKKKSINPYYALDKYSGGDGGDSDTRQSGIQNPPKEIEVQQKQQQESSSVAAAKSVAVVSPTVSQHPSQIYDTPKLSPKTAPDTEPVQYDENEVVELRDRSWEKKFVEIGACYLVYNRADDELNIHYSEIPMKNAVGVWTSNDIGDFKEAQGLSKCELIGTCASHVTRDHKNYYQGWCQFIKAAKNMDAKVIALVGLGLPVDFFMYHENGNTIRVASPDDDGEASFDTESIDAVACVPKGCNFPVTGIVGKKWSKTAKKLGAVALFKRLSSKEVTTEDVNSIQPIHVANEQQSSTIREIPACEEINEQEHIPTPVPVPVPTEELPETIVAEVALTPVPSPEHQEEVADVPIESLSMQIPCPDGGACYLVYDPDSSGRIIEHYGKTPVDFAIGRWVPSSDKKIAGFKFKRNVGRNALIGNCSAGVQGRQNYCSGWCQFVRSAKVMGGEVMMWDPAVGHKGLMVDVLLYYDDFRPHHQTVRMEQAIPYTTDKLLAVACIPKGTPFFEDMTIDILKWLADGSTYGYSSKM
jgi:hypothetical protein